MQAAMLMNKLKAGAAVAETSKLLAAAAAASSSPATTTASTVSVLRGERPKGRGKNRQNQVRHSVLKLSKYGANLIKALIVLSPCERSE